MTKSNLDKNDHPVSGDKMPDGSVYAGVSPDTGKPLYTTPEDATRSYLFKEHPFSSREETITERVFTFNNAAGRAQRLNRQQALGYDDWRVPSTGELKVLFNNRAAIGGFKTSGPSCSALYWSSSRDDGWFGDDTGASYARDFVDGSQKSYPRYLEFKVRCVR